VLRTTRLAVLGLLLLLTSGVGHAQRFPTHTYTVSDGLPSAMVYAAVQDTLGRMWFATRTGIAVYDGHEFQVQGHEAGLIDLHQEFLLRDREGTLYAAGGNPYSQALRHDGSRWVAIGAPGFSDNDYLMVSAAMATLDDEDIIFLGTDDGMLFTYHPSHGWRGQSIPGVGPGEGVTGLLPVPGGLLVTAPSRVVRIGGDADAFTFQEVVRVDDDRLRATVPDGEGGYWVLGDASIHRLRDGRLEPEAATPRMLVSNPETHSALRRYVIEPDGIGGFFAATIERILHYHPLTGARTLGLDNGFASGGATGLVTDREGNLWVTGLRGITKLLGVSLESWDSSHGLHADEVSAVLQRRNGSFVLGHPNGLSLLRDGGIATVSFSEEQMHGRVLDLWEDEDGTVWASCADKGLLRIDPDGHQRWYLRDEHHVNSTLRDAAGTFWVSTMHDLYRMEGGHFRPEGLADEIGAPAIQGRRLFPAADSGFYLASRRYGLIEYESDGTHAWTKVDRSLPGVYALLEWDDGTTWIGTGNGLYALTPDAVVEVGDGARGPRVERPVYFLTRDPVGDVWIGTDNGVLRWDGNSTTHLTIQDGLAGRETNRAAGVVDAAGRMWIGTERGVTIFDRRLQRDPGPGPLASVDAVEVDGDTFALLRDLELPHHHNSLTFQFTTISFLDENRARVESWLEGFDRTWLPAYQSPLQEIRYTNLSPGTYRFHLRAVDAAGRRSPVVSSAPIVITPALWQRPWFWVLAVVVVAAILASWILGISRSRYAMRLEREVEERVRDLAASEAAKAAESRRLSVTLESITDGVITTDAEGRVVLFNPAAASITGWPVAEAVGRPLHTVLQLRSTDALPAELPHGDMALVTREGETRTIEITSAPVRGDSGRGGSVLAFRDITDKRAIEAELSQAQRLQSLGILAGGIAHDFNNLLTVVLGNVSLVAQEADPESARKLGDAREATLRARSLTQQLLTFSRGGAPLRTSASVAEVVRENASFALSGSNSRCQLDLAADLWTVDLDPGQIGQVLNNLLLNASQAMPEGGVVEISARNVSGEVPGLPPGDHVRITVRDSGPGIPADHLTQIFDPYFSTKTEGTGLGLATAYSIVRRHDGLLSVDSTPGQGTTFHIHLPRSVSVAEPTEARTDASPRILVMDDDEDVRTVTASLLRASGYAPTVARDGEEAVATYREAMERGERFAVVIMDLTVRAGMGGRDAMEQILRLDPEARGVVASGYSNDPVLANHVAHGFRGRIPKSFLREDLRRVLGEVLGIETG